ncbi:MAG TPA: hypothetical protein VNG33_22315 [Polyangiaceae bacterium]|nr:hypothetical protein [Polyangiaceae bacterium]
MSRAFDLTCLPFAILLMPLSLGCGSSSSASAAGSSGSSGSEAAASGSAGKSAGGSSSSSAGTSAVGGDQGAQTGGACSFSTAPAAPADADPSASAEAKANAAGLRTLDFVIGRYLRGEASVYSGTAKAQDNRSALVNTEVAGPRPDSVIAEGPALALLQVRPAADRDWEPQNPNPTGTTATLVIHGLPPDQHFILRQRSADPGLTEVSLLSPVSTTAAMATSCSDCAPDLMGKPQKVALTDLTATGHVMVFMGVAAQGGHDVDVTAQVTASADLALLSPCALTFDDLAIVETATGPNEIDNTLQAFKKSGHEMTYMTGGSFNVGGTAMCPLVQPYKIELYVDLDDLSHYGTRNYVAGTAAVACVPGTP